MAERSAESIVRSRRDFVKHGAAFAAGLVALVRIGSPRFAHAQNPSKALDPAGPIAQSLGYSHDATKVDAVKYPRRKEPGAEKQNCSNCILMQSVGLKAEGQEGEWGKCALFQDGLVNVKGWCNSYAAKPGAV